MLDSELLSACEVTVQLLAFLPEEEVFAVGSFRGEKTTQKVAVRLGLSILLVDLVDYDLVEWNSAVTVIVLTLRRVVNIVRAHLSSSSLTLIEFHTAERSLCAGLANGREPSVRLRGAALCSTINARTF